MRKERRKDKRYASRWEAVKTVVVAGRKKFSVKDISMGGLKLEYVPEANAPFRTEMIDLIAMLPTQLYLPRMKCKTVYDILTLAENRTFSGGTIRLRGLRFLGLDDQQKRSLTTIINHFQEGSVPSCKEKGCT
ncbi:hypothetical protein DESC_600085 [Desulfosarcina cetonica]|uniref:PilZ domain-containing protein n=1 Tax=Desulfosarcina cetonica TaxID=90730 RepID=UPI0012EE3EC5|nr:PilZ domain-containing protein [Desulfosarcina cetonica]VTR67371.1 hypothetical protein DESC_600085 [Desulfosarcina cetonica]